MSICFTLLIESNQTVMIYISRISYMTEYSTPEQANPTPQQLNTELTSALDLLPQGRLSGIAFEGDETGEKAGLYTLAKGLKRLDSEYGQRLQDRVTELVSRASITERFKEYIVDEFAGWLEEGRDPETSTGGIAKAFFFLDRGHPGSGGIFDPKRAVTLERVALAQEVGQLTWGQKALARIFGEERAKELYAPKRHAVEEWREQIKQCYGEEVPNTPD